MSHTRQPSESARQAATAWHARLRAGGGTVDDLEQARFLAWLDTPGNAEAWRETLALWDLLGTPAEALGRDGWHRPRASRRRTFRWAIAASLLLACTSLLLLWRDPGLYDRLSADVATAVGEQRELRLPDGSRILLDSNAALDIRIDDSGRWITLRRGRAAFEVADIRTPFVVHSGTVSVHDLGTRFVVDRRRHGSSVTVDHGTVRVEAPGRTAQILGRGQRAKIAEQGAIRVHPVDLDIALAWERGVLLYDETPLGRVILDFNRYSGERIVLARPELRDLPVTGTFRTDDARAGLRALESGLGLRVVRLPGMLTLIH